MSRRVLHILSQRPSRTGSGVTLDAMVRKAANAGWHQAVVVGLPHGEAKKSVGDLGEQHTHPVWFASDSQANTHPSQMTQHPDLDILIPGMSDVMPYPSTVWSTMTIDQLAQYRSVWRSHLVQIIESFAPDIIHTHHIWLVSSLLKDIAPQIPVVATCHSTGLRQMVLTPNLASEVQAGCAKIDQFCVLRADQGQTLQETLGVSPKQVNVIGAGYRHDLFVAPLAAQRDLKAILFVGKLSRAKGLPWLLTAFEKLRRTAPDLKLHIAGGGSGPEAEIVRNQCENLAPQVVLHGALDQPQLAALMGRSAVCVLPSFYEGVPLVLVEAAACGCQIVATKLPGVCEQIAPHLGPNLRLVPLPRLHHIDQPEEADLPAFIDHLSQALEEALQRAATNHSIPKSALATFT